jgi:hypothetical protein
MLFPDTDLWENHSKHNMLRLYYCTLVSSKNGIYAKKKRIHVFKLNPSLVLAWKYQPAAVGILPRVITYADRFIRPVFVNPYLITKKRREKTFSVTFLYVLETYVNIFWLYQTIIQTVNLIFLRLKMSQHMLVQNKSNIFWLYHTIIPTVNLTILRLKMSVCMRLIDITYLFSEMVIASLWKKGVIWW